MPVSVVLELLSPPSALMGAPVDEYERASDVGSGSLAVEGTGSGVAARAVAEMVAVAAGPGERAGGEGPGGRVTAAFPLEPATLVTLAAVALAAVAPAGFTLLAGGGGGER
jgi:hypothetical protein